ncbi:unnamed protein product, partial [Ectocarpus sp. 13 AM-2016]
WRYLQGTASQTRLLKILSDSSDSSRHNNTDSTKNKETASTATQPPVPLANDDDDNTTTTTTSTKKCLIVAEITRSPVLCHRPYHCAPPGRVVLCCAGQGEPTP